MRDVWGSGCNLQRWLLCFVSVCLLPLRCGGDDSGVEVQFPIGPDGASFVPGEVFGEQQQFIIDTGSSFSVLDFRFRERLGPPVKKIGFMSATDKRRADLFTAPEIRLGDGRHALFQSNSTVCCFDFATIKSASGIEDLGILGMDYLQTRILRLKFDDGLGETRFEAAMDASHVERLHTVRDRPYVLARLPSEGIKRFLVDTGSAGLSVILERDVFDRLLQKRQLVVLTNRKKSGVDREAVVRCGILESLEFGPHRFFNVTVNEGAENTLGLSFLKRFEVEFDFPKRVARFRPGRLIDEAEMRSRVDLGVKRIQGRTLAVVTGEPAESLQGIQDGDRLHRVNGESADELPLSKIRLLFRQPDADLTISYEHNGVTKQVVLHLSNDPDPFPAKSPHELIETTPDFDF